MICSPCFEKALAGTKNATLPGSCASSAMSLPVKLLAFLGLFLVGSITAPAQGPAKTTLIIKTAKGATQAQVQAAINGNGGTLKRSIPKLDLHVIEVPAQGGRSDYQ